MDSTLHSEEWENLEDLKVSGYGLWRRKESHGGYSYLTDAIGCGHLFWDEGLHDIEVVIETLVRAGWSDKIKEILKELDKD